MKKRLLLMIVAFAGTITAQTIPTIGLIGQWEFTGNLNDGSGNGNNGISTSAPGFTVDRCGNANSAVHFNGTSNYVEIQANGPQGGVARSVSFWMKTTNTS